MSPTGGRLGRAGFARIYCLHQLTEMLGSCPLRQGNIHLGERVRVDLSEHTLVEWLEVDTDPHCAGLHGFKNHPSTPRSGDVDSRNDSHT